MRRTSVRSRRALAAACLWVAAASARGAAQAPAPRLVLDPARLSRAGAFLQGEVDAGRIAGAVLVVRQDGRVAYETAVGWQDREAKVPMSPRTIFRIASQTKALTTVVVLSLVEEGKIGLDDPVARWLPTFAHTTVAVATDTGRAIVPAKRPITIRDLLTHTAGISYGTEPLVAPLYAAAGLGPAAGWGWYTADKAEPICTTMDRLGTLPFVAQPGAAFVYGYNTDLLGCIAERAAGKPLDALVAERITGPLGMTDTHFFLPGKDRARLATVYQSDSSRRAVRAPDGARGQGHYVDGPRQSFSGGAGLLSTARDYARFLEMLRQDGALDGRRILSPKTVAVMHVNQVGRLFAADGGMGFGYGFSIVERPGADRLLSVGTYNWGGAYGSTYYVDPTERLVIQLMIQLIPSTWTERDRVATLVYQALVPAR